MTTIIPSFERAAKVALTLFSYDLKISYFLSDQTVSIGYAGELGYYLKNLDSYTMAQRLKMMRNTLNKDEDASNLRMINGYLEHAKKYYSIKHPPTEMIKVFKTFENITGTIYKEWRLTLENDLTKIGYNQINDLSDGIALGYNFMIEDIHQWNKPKNCRLNVESLIKLQLPEEVDFDKILLLNDVFYQEPIIKDKFFISPLHTDASSTSCSYIYNIIEIPNMHIYTTTELKAIRESLREPLKSFRQKVDEWCIICNSVEDKTAGHSFFVVNIIPLVNETNNVIQNHPIMKHHFELFGGYKSYVMMGETTKELLLNYYLYYEFIKEEKYNEIKENCIAENCWDRRIPIIFTSVHQTPTFPSKTDFEDLNTIEDIKSIRKFISTD